jgi:acyl-CoA reductase-like NAD-dependent aldehyde dehydrogenase
VINPATGRTLTAAPRADRAQLDQAVAAAKTAFPTWSATPLRQRAALLVKLAEALEAEQGQFARLLTQEQGKPLPQALDEIARSVATLRYFATLDLPPEVLKEDATQKVVHRDVLVDNAGAALEQPEGNVGTVECLYERIRTRLPSLRLVPGQTLRFEPKTSFRGPLSLLVEWDT